jgi:hypothetical protein
LRDLFPVLFDDGAQMPPAVDTPELDPAEGHQAAEQGNRRRADQVGEHDHEQLGGVLAAERIDARAVLLAQRHLGHTFDRLLACARVPLVRHTSISILTKAPRRGVGRTIPRLLLR